MWDIIGHFVAAALLLSFTAAMVLRRRFMPAQLAGCDPASREG